MTQDRVIRAEQEADAARDRLEQSLNELRGRLTPGRMIDEALDYSRDGQVGEFVRNFGGQIKSNPLPVALVGAGLAWLMLGRGGSSGYAESDIESRYRAAGDTPSSKPSLKDKAPQTATQAAKAADAAFTSATDTAADAYKSATRSASHIADRMGRTAEDMSGRATDMRRKTSERLSHMVEEYPLVLGVIGLALGAAVGSALPGTRTEDRMAGDVSKEFKRQAKREMSEQADKAMNVAERAYDSAVKEGQRAASEAGWTAPEKEKSSASDAQYTSS